MRLPETLSRGGLALLKQLKTVVLGPEALTSSKGKKLKVAGNLLMLNQGSTWQSSPSPRLQRLFREEVVVWCEELYSWPY